MPTDTTDTETREKLIAIINAGLVSGLGTPHPGSLCVEAAICLAMGESHSDRPSCVAEPDRDFAIRINDAMWSSPAARAEALLPLALAQLGTAGSDRTAWVQRVVEGTIRQIVPIALRAAASVHPHEKHRAALEGAATRCEQEGTRAAAAAAAADAAWGAYTTAAAEAAAAEAAAAEAAAAAAWRAYTTAAYAADAHSVNAVATVADADYAAAADRDDAYAYAYAYDAADRDDVLRVAVQIALDAYAADTVSRLTDTVSRLTDD